MANYDLLTNLLPLLEEYEAQKSSAENADIESFAAWLNTRVAINKLVKDKRIPAASEDMANRGEDMPVTLGKLVYYMYRYARFYTKKALKDQALHSLDEFTFLVTMMHMPPISKTELINKMVYDKTSGMEIIKRLIRDGLLAETDNPDDKRSKLVTITDLGRGVLFSSFGELGKVSRIIPGNLTSDELYTLIHLLDKLDVHHLEIWNNERDSDLDTIIASTKH
jgi:DNA-binding MarR family transcriptional regulator